MSRTFTCPHCERALVAREEFFGKRVRCPGCQQPFLLEVPAEPPAPAVIPLLPDTPPPPPLEPAPAAPSWRSYAEDADIDLREKARQRGSNESAVSEELAAWQKDFPEKESAYVPSGALPLPALVFMSVGALVGVAAGALAGVVTAAIGGVAMAITFCIIGILAEVCGCFLCITFVIAVIVVLGAYFCTFLATGLASGATVAWMGTFGKNRNVPVPALLSALSAAAATGLFWIAWQQFGARVTEEAFEMQPNDLDLTYLIGLGVGGVIAMITAAVTARQMVHDMKFCEDCEEYMEESALPGLRLGGLRGMHRALDEEKIPIAAALCQSPRGQSAAPKLFHCKQCGKGFIELLATFKMGYKDKDNNEQTKEESWLVASVPLATEQVALFKKHLKKAGETETDEDEPDE